MLSSDEERETKRGRIENENGGGKCGGSGGHRANYSAYVDADVWGDVPVIVVIDEGGDAMSVTNDAEAVVAEVVARHGNHPVVYRDSDGRWDILDHTDDGVFSGFVAVGGPEQGRHALERALSAARKFAAAGRAANQAQATSGDADRMYYYRPLAFYGGRILKCAGFGAEVAEHRAFYVPYFDSHLDDGMFLPGVKVLQGFRGDRIFADNLTEFRG